MNKIIIPLLDKLQHIPESTRYRILAEKINEIIDEIKEVKGGEQK